MSPCPGPTRALSLIPGESQKRTRSARRATRVTRSSDLARRGVECDTRPQPSVREQTRRHSRTRPVWQDDLLTDSPRHNTSTIVPWSATGRQGDRATGRQDEVAPNTDAHTPPTSAHLRPRARSNPKATARRTPTRRRRVARRGPVHHERRFRPERWCACHRIHETTRQHRRTRQRPPPRAHETEHTNEGRPPHPTTVRRAAPRVCLGAR